MNIAGFEEAFASSVSLLVEDGFSVRVASIPGLALLKLVAWLDRRHSTRKDAADIRRLIATYGDAAAQDRLYEQEMPLLEEHGFDTQLAGAKLLGRELAGLATRSTRDAVSRLVSDDITFELLLDHAVQTSVMAETADASERLLQAFRRGPAAHHRR